MADEYKIGDMVEVHAAPSFWRRAVITKIVDQVLTLQDTDPDRKERIYVILASEVRQTKGGAE